MIDWLRKHIRALGIWISITFIVTGIVVTVGFIISLSFQFDAQLMGKIKMAESGQTGDFIGGVVGTFFALSGTILLLLTLREQVRQSEKEAFKSSFFEMVHLHRENVSEQRCKKYYEGEFSEASSRQVFTIIFQEFIDCFHEVRKFARDMKPKECIKAKYVDELMKSVKQENKRIDILELALIDIAYSIVFYGLGGQGELVLRERLKKRYNDAFIYRVLFFMKLKLRQTNDKSLVKWQELRSLPIKELRQRIDEAYEVRATSVDANNLEDDVNDILKTIKEYPKYYDGQQYRLGHYFRHLYQSFKFIDEQEILGEEEKYGYAKILRAQLSPHEQGLLFVNSLSRIGFNWEYKTLSTEKTGLITKYNLIKNLPGTRLFDIKFKNYYPEVNYENQ
jgi:hypothetical protein